MSPVLLITFNRPIYVRKVVDALRLAKVAKLFVFKDGPRPQNIDDRNKSFEIEQIISGIDWECDVKTNYMQNNLGCGYGPFTAISWAFQYTDQLIILEDDCVPSVPFFDFCSYLLNKYQNDERVRHISGYSQFQDAEIFKRYDYVFTQYAPTWGWATWKRVWNDMDMQERLIKPFFANGGFTNQFSTPVEARFFNNYYWRRTSPLFEATHSWDYQYAVHSKMNGALSIVPSKNLIQYIGEEGTHPASRDFYKLLSNCTYEIKKEPINVSMDSAYEQLYFQKYCTIPFLRNVKLNLIQLKNRLFGRPDFK